MAKCICGNDIETCAVCRRNRTIEQFGGHHNGDVTTTKERKGLTKLYLEEAKQENPPKEREAKEEEIMIEYVKKSFTVVPEETKEDNE
jgi:hypothetical protein